MKFIKIPYPFLLISFMAILMDKPGIVSSLFVVVVVVVVGLARTSEGTSYTVGGSAGWDLSADFGSWLQNKTFYVGDALCMLSSLLNLV